MKRKLVMFAVAIAVGPAFTQTAQARQERAVAVKCPGVVTGVKYYRSTAWHLKTVVGLRKHRSVFNPWKIKSCNYARWVADLWRERARSARKVYENPPHKAQWNCIHGYEGSWDAATGNGYYGGLQMDISFQRHYGSWLLSTKGTANNWTMLEQMWVAERAYRSGRGFYPWPNTARYCGLI